MVGPSSASACTFRSEMEMDKVVCRFFANSECEEGDDCQFPHVPKEGRFVDSCCRFFLRNKCHFGKLCSMDHVIVVDRNDGKKVLQIIQQQLGMRKRQMEAQNVKVHEIPPSSNAHLADEVSSRAKLINESGVGNFCFPGPSKSHASEKRLTVASIGPNIKCEERKVCQRNLAETALKPDNSENVHIYLTSPVQSYLKSGERQFNTPIAIESESKDTSSGVISQVSVHDLHTNRSEVRQTSGFSKSDSKHGDRISGGTFVVVKSLQAGGNSAAWQNTADDFDLNEQMVLYNTRILLRGRTAEEIALFGEFSFLPVDSSSRVPLYMRRATPREPNSEHVGKEAENAKKGGENIASKQTQNGNKPEEGIASKQTENDNKAKRNIASKQTENDNKAKWNIASKQTENDNKAKWNIASKQTENDNKAKRNIASKQTENDNKAEEKNGAFLQHIAEEKYIFTPSGRRVGLNPQYSAHFPYEDM